MMMTIVYSRVSTEDQVVEGYSLQSQHDACMKKAYELGATDEDIISLSDEGISGEVLTRPGIEKARDLVKKGNVRYFVCYHPDRLSRDVINQAIIIRELNKRSVNVEFVNFRKEPGPQGDLMFHMVSAFAQYEKDLIRERTKRGKLEKARQNKLPQWAGTYGYRYTHRNGSNEGQAVIDEEQADIVRCIYHWFTSEDLGYHGIAKRLNEEGIPSPKGTLWYKATVSRIIKNTAYKGVFVVNKNDTSGTKNNKYRNADERVSRKIRPEEEWIRLNLPELMIIDETIWEAANRKAAQVRRIHAGLNQGRYLLSGISRCGLCGATVHGNLISRKLAYYTCTHKSPGVPGEPKCSLSSVQSHLVDEMVWSKVKEWLTTPKLLAEHLGRENSNVDYSKEISKLHGMIEGKRRERTRLSKLFTKGLIPEEEVDRELSAVKNDINRWERRIEELSRAMTSIPSKRDAIKAIKELASQIGDGLDELSFEKRKEIVRHLIAEVIFSPNEVTIRARVPQGFL